MKNFRMLSLIVLAVCLLFLCSCDGSFKVEYIEAKAMFTNQELRLPISSNHAILGLLAPSGMYGYMTFSSKQSIEELYEIAKDADSTLTCTLGADYVLIFRNNADKTKDYFWIRESEKMGYSFSGMRAGLITGINSKGRQESRAVLLPYHLVSDDRVGVNFSDLYLNAEYETTAGAEEFYQFYADSGWYDVELKDGCVLLNGYKHPDAVMENPADAERYGTLKFDRKLKIQFREFADQRYFQFVFAEESDTK